MLFRAYLSKSFKEKQSNFLLVTNAGFGPLCAVSQKTAAYNWQLISRRPSKNPVCELTLGASATDFNASVEAVRSKAQKENPAAAGYRDLCKLCVSLLAFCQSKASKAKTEKGKGTWLRDRDRYIV